MSDHSFTSSFWVDRTPEEAYAAITNVRGWWSADVEGGTAEAGQEFRYRYEDQHRCTIRVTEAVPGRKVRWLVLENHFGSADVDTEWTGTTIEFDLAERNGRTEIRFAHQGLVPAHECYDNCSTAWGFFVNTSLRDLIVTGEGRPLRNGRPGPSAEDLATGDAAPALPPVVDRATWQAERDALLVQEKAHTHAGDRIAAARRRLPMVEVDPAIPVVGPDGPVTLLDVFEGRRQLIAYFHMWHHGQPAAGQCEGCTFYNGQVRELSQFHRCDVTYATLCQGPYEESVRYRDFMGWEVPWYSVRDSADALLAGRGPFALVCYLRHGDRVFETYSTGGRAVEAMAPAYGLLDMTVYGRQEKWEDSPAGWPQVNGEHVTGGRPNSQWSRLAAGRSDDLSAAAR